jgi:ssDNA-binding Zn-finger/Zn-ribbon topoisomerase 1
MKIKLPILGEVYAGKPKTETIIKEVKNKSVGGGFLDFGQSGLSGETTISQKLLAANVGWVYRNNDVIAKEVANIERVTIEKEYSDKVCPLCGKQLIIRSGRYGKFLGCSGFPECRHIEPFTLDIKCPDCGDAEGGKLVERVSTKGKFKSKFYGCSRYPECKFLTKKLPDENKTGAEV